MTAGVLLLVLKTMASCSTAGTNLSLAPMMLRIYQDKSTGEKSHLPLVAMLINCHMW